MFPGKIAGAVKRALYLAAVDVVVTRVVVGMRASIPEAQ